MNKIVFLDDVIDALVEKGQEVRRGEIGGWWLLNAKEIREALDTVPIIDLKVTIRERELFGNSEQLQDTEKPKNTKNGFDTCMNERKTHDRTTDDSMSGAAAAAHADPEFESCDDCIHADDSMDICLLRRCIHADKLKECYQRKGENDGRH